MVVSGKITHTRRNGKKLEFSTERKKTQKIQTNMDKNNKMQNYNIINQKNSKIDIEKQWQQSDVPKVS